MNTQDQRHTDVDLDSLFVGLPRARRLVEVMKRSNFSPPEAALIGKFKQKWLILKGIYLARDAYPSRADVRFGKRDIDC